MTLLTGIEREKPSLSNHRTRRLLTYVIAEPCVNTKDASCVDVCPVECIYESDPEPGTLKLPMFIHPDECIDCGACEPECPVEAIFTDEDLPDNWTPFLQANADLATEADM